MVTVRISAQRSSEGPRGPHPGVWARVSRERWGQGQGSEGLGALESSSPPSALIIPLGKEHHETDLAEMQRRYPGSGVTKVNEFIFPPADAALCPAFTQLQGTPETDPGMVTVAKGGWPSVNRLENIKSAMKAQRWTE